MMHKQSHRGRWMYNPLGQIVRPSPWRRFLGLLDDLFAPMLLEEGRRQIDPEQPWGTWSAGWNGPTLPGEKKNAR